MDITFCYELTQIIPKDESFIELIIPPINMGFKADLEAVTLIIGVELETWEATIELYNVDDFTTTTTILTIDSIISE